MWFFGFFVGGGFSFNFNFNFPTVGPESSRDGRRDASPEWIEDLARWIGENLVLLLVVVILLVLARCISTLWCSLWFGLSLAAFGYYRAFWARKRPIASTASHSMVA